MTRPLLVHVPYSPWSLKARLALELGGIDHDRRVYLPTLTEPWLRLKLRRPRGKVTVPVLFTRGQALTDSLEIARYALADSPWWRDEHAIAHWNDWSQQLLELGRIRTTARVHGDPAALQASLPHPLTRMGPLGMMLGRDAARRLMRKYPVSSGHDIEEAMDGLVRELDRGLSGRRFLAGEDPGYADITAAVGLSFVQAPLSLPVGAASRPHWEVPDLVTRHGHLLRWRDRVLERCAEAAARG